MVLWIVMAAMAVAASLAVLVPLYRGRATPIGERPAALAIYKDQLGEVERDLGRGLIAAEEANAARTEIARRLIKADAADDGDGGSREASEGRRRVAALAAIIAVPVLALGCYLFVGSPGLPDRPLAARLDGPLEAADLPALVARIEAHLAASPDDGQGWSLLAPVYMQAGRYPDAIRAFGNTIRLLGPTAGREADLGDAIMRANQGVVTDDAKAAFEAASKLDPSAAKPRFFLAVALTQEGARDPAIAAWHQLLDGAPADAPWVPVAKAALARLAGAAPPSAPSATPGPSASDVAAASGMTPEARQAMIGGMVDKLAVDLKAQPDNPDGWARLIRSYMVLGRKDDASAALASARAALAGKTDGLAAVEAEARSSGLIE